MNRKRRTKKLEWANSLKPLLKMKMSMLSVWKKTIIMGMILHQDWREIRVSFCSQIHQEAIIIMIEVKPKNQTIAISKVWPSVRWQKFKLLNSSPNHKNLINLQDLESHGGNQCLKEILLQGMMQESKKGSHKQFKRWRSVKTILISNKPSRRCYNAEKVERKRV